MNATIKLHNKNIKNFETLRDKKLKEYDLDTLNDLYKLITLIEEIKKLTSDSQFKDLEKSELESFLKGSIEGTITSQVLGNELTQLRKKINDLDTERNDKRSELAKAELDVKKEPEFLVEHLENEEISSSRRNTRFKKRVSCNSFRNFYGN